MHDMWCTVNTPGTHEHIALWFEARFGPLWVKDGDSPVLCGVEQCIRHLNGYSQISCLKDGLQCYIWNDLSNWNRTQPQPNRFFWVEGVFRCSQVTAKACRYCVKWQAFLMLTLRTCFKRILVRIWIWEGLLQNNTSKSSWPTIARKGESSHSDAAVVILKKTFISHCKMTRMLLSSVRMFKFIT